MIKQATVQVSVGMRPSGSTNSTGVSMRGAKPCLERDPLRHITVERSSEKERWHLSQSITLLYGCSHLAAKRVASRLYVTVAALPIPLEVLKSSGVNNPCSTSRTRCAALPIPLEVLKTSGVNNPCYTSRTRCS